MSSYLLNTCWYLLIVSTLLVNVEASTAACKLNKFESDANIMDLWANKDLKSAQILRKDLVNHIKFIENMINILDDWAFEEISNITESEKFNKENYNLYKSQVGYLQRNYTHLSEELQKVNTSDDAQVIKTRNVELKTELVSLKTNLDEKTTKGLLLVSAYQESDNIVNKYESLCDDFDIFIEKTIAKEQSIIAEKCIEIIKNKNFDLADNVFNQITDYNKISYIVNKSYSPRNFYTVLNLIDHITNLPIRFHLLKELEKEVRLKGHLTLNNRLSLANSLTKKIINVAISDREITPKVIELMDHIRADIKSLTVMYLVDVLQDNKTIKDCNFQLLTEIFLLDSNLAFDIFHQAYIFSDNNGENVAVKFQEIFEILLKTNTKSLLDSDLIELIQDFFVKIGNADYGDRSLEFFRDKPIPQVVKTILLAKKMGIKGNGYLRSSSEPINNTYTVYSHSEGGYVNYEFWILKKNSTFFKIRSYPFENFYLDVDKYDNVILNNENSLNSGLWKLELEGEEYCLIKNVGNNKYLYTLTNNSPAQITELDVQNKDKFLWSITDLSDT